MLGVLWATGIIGDERLSGRSTVNRCSLGRTGGRSRVQAWAAGSREYLHSTGADIRFNQGPGLCSSCWAFFFFQFSLHVPAPLLDVSLPQADIKWSGSLEGAVRRLCPPHGSLFRWGNVHLCSGVQNTLREMLNFSVLLLPRFPENQTSLDHQL